MPFIQLTQTNGRDIYINKNFITSFVRINNITRITLNQPQGAQPETTIMINETCEWLLTKLSQTT